MNVGESFLAGASPNVTHKEGKATIQVASLFNQLLQHFPRTGFGAPLKENNVERCAKAPSVESQMVIPTTYSGAGMTWIGITGGNDRPRSDNPDSQFSKPSFNSRHHNPVLFWAAVRMKMLAAEGLIDPRDQGKLLCPSKPRSGAESPKNGMG